MLGHGHREIAFIQFTAVRKPESDSRFRGYRDALEDAGAPFGERLGRYAALDAGSGYDRMRSLLDSGAAMSALVAGNFTITIGALAAIHGAGLRVPQHIAVIGHGDIPVARFTTPALSTVRVPAEALGRRCGELVIRQLNGERIEPRTVILPPRFIIRDSCGASMVNLEPAAD